MAKRGIIVIFFVLVAILGGYFIWQKYYCNSDCQAKKALQAKYIQAMTQDSYGGKTQQETLDLFIIALKSNDAELASKYFMLDENISREKWLKTLNIFKDKGLLDEMAKDIKPETVIMEENTYSKVWKIKDLK